MKQQLTLPAALFAAISAGRPFLLTKYDPLVEVGDTLVLTEDGTRNQMERRITYIETEHMFKGYCVVALADVAPVAVQEGRVTMLSEAKQSGEPMID